MKVYTQKCLPFILLTSFLVRFLLKKVKYSLKKDRERLIIRNNILWKILFM